MLQVPSPSSISTYERDCLKLLRDFILRSVSNSPFPSDFLLLLAEMAREIWEVEAGFERETARFDFFSVANDRGRFSLTEQERTGSTMRRDGPK